MNHHHHSALIVGAGPAGLSAAEESRRTGRRVTVVEQDPAAVGGLARTVEYKGFRFDIGAHRFFSKNPDIRSRWQTRLGPDFIEIDRLTRILYRGRYFHYPLRLPNVLRQLGVAESMRCLMSYVAAKVRPTVPEATFEDWVRNRFGARLFRIFFKSYTEKVWGIPCEQISADWAAQRIRGLSMFRAIAESLGLQPKERTLKTLIDRFHYPRLGAGMMWERTRSELERSGVQFCMGQRVLKIVRTAEKVTAVETLHSNGSTAIHTADDFIFSMPLGELALAIDPPLPEPVRSAARALRYRHLMVVLLVVDRPALFPDHWIYIHDPQVSVGRIANVGNWSRSMVPDGTKSGLALDYFCSDGDTLWDQPDADILIRARAELERLQIAPAGSVSDGHVVRAPRAYPVFDDAYKTHTRTIRDALRPLTNLYVAGRNGMHKYNNQDHSMLTGIMAARAANGEQVDPWKVNIDAEYLEEENDDASDSVRITPRSTGGRLTGASR